MYSVESLRETLCSMKPGQMLKIQHHQLKDVVTPPYYPGDPLDYVIEGIVGAMYRFRRFEDAGLPYMSIERKADDGTIWFIDADRREYYTKMPDGSYVNNGTHGR